MSVEQIKVLIVDDSKVSRDLLAYIIGLDPEIKVIGFAENGVEALEFINRDRPDVIITDIEMPIMNGFQLTRKIMESDPIPIIVISGVYNEAEVATGFEAIEAGALAIIEKPKGLGDSHCMDTARFVAETIKTMSQVKLRAEEGPKASTAPRERSIIEDTKYLNKSDIEAIGIGASVGGPKAIRTILSQLSSGFPVPIFVVQHITSGFIEGFINWLNSSTTFNVKIAEENESIKTGTVYVCPDQQLMSINNKIIQLKPTTPVEQSQYSISTLFDSMVENYKKNCVGILLTGIGTDGSKELLKLKNLGAYTIAQDEKSSIKHNLPQSAIDIGAATKIMPLSQIAAVLENLIKERV